MKKSKISLAILSLLAAAILMVSCVEDQIDRTYTGPAVAEFKNIYLERQGQLGAGNLLFAYPYVVVGENTSLTALVVREQPIVIQDSILVQIVGPLSEQNQELNYEVSSASTAVAGVNYNILGTPGKVTIPAGKSSGYIRLDVLNGIPPLGPSRINLILTLQGNSEILPSENYKTFTYTIVNN